jgi:ribose-phosphate pyrophosphokinase
MKTLDLIYPEKSDISFKLLTFPDGQPHIKIDVDSAKKLDLRQPLRIRTRVDSPAAILMALFVKNTLDYMEFEHVELHVSYLMAARMDRVMLDGEPFSLKVAAQILNGANFRKVKVFDPHSEVTTALIERSFAVSNHDFVKDALTEYTDSHGSAPFCLVSPDGGALKKIHKLAQYLGVENVVECMKERDVRTGALTNFKTMTDNLAGQTCFIVDDICDGGGTFAGTAAMLKAKGAAKVVLIVSHGIFSRGPVIESVDEVFTTDSFRKVEGVRCLPVEKYI